MTAKELEDPWAERLCLSLEGAVALRSDAAPRPMYQSLSEVLSLIATVLEERTGTKVHTFRTLESGAIEEHAVFERGTARRTLLFRVWPFFFPHQKRLECKIYVRDPEICDQILHYLGACATANGATMVLKD